MKSTIASFCLCLMPIVNEHVLAVDPPQSSTITLNLELVFEQASCRVFENVPLQVRIVNPNSFPVILRGFQMGYIEPEIHVLGGDGEFHKLYYGAMDSAWNKIPVTIPAHGAIAKDRLLYEDFAAERWPNEPGNFTLRPKTHIETCKLKDDGEDVGIDWEIRGAVLRVERATTTDQSGITFLREKLQAYGAITDPGKQPSGPFRIALFADFLRRYEKSTYTPEIRWELAKLLQLELGNHTALYGNEPMQRLWSECLKFCLDCGGGFAEEFTRWDWSHGGSSAMDIARQIGDLDLTRRVASAIDARYPEDQSGILFRLMIVEGISGNQDSAAATARELETRFPKSQYAKDLPQQLESLKRNAPKKSARE